MSRVIQGFENFSPEVYIFSEQNSLSKNLYENLIKKGCDQFMVNMKNQEFSWNSFLERFNNSPREKPRYFLILLQEQFENNTEKLMVDIDKLLNIIKINNSKTVVVFPYSF